MLRRYSRPGFRRRAFVKRRKFGYRAKSKRTYKKRLIGGAARAARSTYTNTPICRDLGMLWPSCLITKLRYHAFLPADFRTGTGAVITNTADEGHSYSAFFTFWPADVGIGIGPLRGCTYGGGTSATAYANKTGFSVLTNDAMGIDKLLAAAGAGAATGTYSKCCVLSARYQFTISMFHGSSDTDLLPIPMAPPSMHMLHPMCNKDPVITPLTTTVSVDSMWNQPDVKRRYVAKATGSVQGNSGGSATVISNIPGHVVKWKGTIWPHKLLDKTFTDYVSDDNSFGTSAAMPANYAGLQFAGFIPELGADATFFAFDRAVLHCNVVFTCLFKDVAGTLS